MPTCRILFGYLAAYTCVFDSARRYTITIVVGRETAGLPGAWMEAEPGRVVTIPQLAGERCLNQATAAGIITFEALRQLSYSTI